MLFSDSAIVPRTYQSPFLLKLGRLAAILSLAVVVAGKAVHLHQEYACCSNSLALNVEGDSSADGCPFGCNHHSDGETAECPDSAPADEPPKHDENRCRICIQLAQAPDRIIVAELPEPPKTVIQAIFHDSDTPADGVTLAAQSRGPPRSV